MIVLLLGLRFLLLSISEMKLSNTVKIYVVFYVDCILQHFYKYHPYHLSIQIKLQNY